MTSANKIAKQQKDKVMSNKNDFIKLRNRYSDLYRIYFDFSIKSVKPHLHNGKVYIQLEIPPFNCNDDTLALRNKIIDEIDRIGGANEKIPSDDPAVIIFRLIEN